MNIFNVQFLYIHYRSKVCGHLEISWFLKEKHIFCPLKYHLIDQKYSVDIVNVVNDYCSWKRQILLSSSVQCLCSFAHFNILSLLARLRYGFSFATLPRRPASRSRLFTVDVETGVCGYYLMKLPGEDLRRLFLKLDSLYLSSCSVVHRGLPLLFLFWLAPVCSVL